MADHIAKSSCTTEKSSAGALAESAANKLNESLYKEVSAYVNSKYKDKKLDVLLFCALTISNNSSADREIDKYLSVQEELSKHNVSNDILTIMFMDIDLKYLLGKNYKSSVDTSNDKEYPRRLDKIMKPTLSVSDTDSSQSITEGTTPFVEWGNINSLSWKDVIEPISVNMNNGNYNITSVPNELDKFAKLVYLYYELSLKSLTSLLDNAELGLAFPLTNEQLKYAGMTSPFGPRGTGFHTGMDFFPDSPEQLFNTPIHCIANGVVCAIGDDGETTGAGKFVETKHDCTASPTGYIIAEYCHLNSIAVSEGQSVTKGQVIGTMGHTGHCIPSGMDGTHLHFQTNETGMSGSDGVDPVKYFPKLGAVVETHCVPSIYAQLTGNS